MTRAKDIEALVPYDFDTLEECCESKFGTQACHSYDMCAPTASPSLDPTASSPARCQGSGKWHPNSISTVCINFDETSHSGELNMGLVAISLRNKETLSNSQQLPPQPVTNIYNTLQECCEAVFGSDADCIYLDLCSIKPVDSNPTKNPSDGPAESPASNSFRNVSYLHFCLKLQRKISIWQWQISNAVLIFSVILAVGRAYSAAHRGKSSCFHKPFDYHL